MKIFQMRVFFIFIAVIFLLSACVGKESANQNANLAENNKKNANLNPPKDDIEEFAKIVNLSLTPEEVTWRETDAQNSKKLIAVLKFSAQDTQTIVSQAEKHKPAVPAELDAETWFPPELIAKSQESGDETLKGSEFAANDFFLNDYKNGRVVRINDSNFFVLELSN